jgi:hypothetical protein
VFQKIEVNRSKKGPRRRLLLWKYNYTKNWEKKKKVLPQIENRVQNFRNSSRLLCLRLSYNPLDGEISHILAQVDIYYLLKIKFR